jgi:hypothetical protein
LIESSPEYSNICTPCAITHGIIALISRSLITVENRGEPTKVYSDSLICELRK